MTRLCVPIFVTSLAQAKRDIASVCEAGADLVELRIDQFTDPADVKLLVSECTMPCIVTCRPENEGGRCTLDDQTRLAALQAAVEAGADYVDLELATYRRCPELAAQLAPLMGEETRCTLILSAHDFSGRPDKLYSLIAEMDQSPADVVKIAWAARTIRDNFEAFELLQHRAKPMIALCMGEAGILSRILARKFGALLTFTSLDKNSGTAPGQVPIADLKRLYRWDAIGRKTRVYGVVASPVMHSMSPAIHNAAFAHIGHDGVFLPMLVNEGYESFKAFMETALIDDGLDLSGLAVTLPHKENALRYLTEKGAQVEDLARRIGAMNTIIIDRENGRAAIRGLNSDYAAILGAITDKLGIARETLAKYRVAVIGAGGTGRTAVAALAHYGANVIVYNRTLERAQALAAEFNGQTGPVAAAPLEQLPDCAADIFINTTSIGMHPKIDATPFGDTPPRLTPQTLVFDAVYNPIKTRLLSQAQAAGAQTISGVEMFVRQAVTQFEAWTKKPAPADIMRQVIESRLTPHP